jgi:hypothetical protein
LPLLLLAGCVSTQKLRQAELAELAGLLPGNYDNTGQASADAAAGITPAHGDMRLMITAVYAPLVAERVFHVRETAADDPRRLISQQVWTLSLDADARIVQGIHLLAEPERWRTGDPELFRSILPQDLRPLTGCELVWQKTAGGFSGANQPASCRARSRLDDAAVTVEHRAKLGGELLDLSERQFDADGRVVAGLEADPYYHFVRRRR